MPLLKRYKLLVLVIIWTAFNLLYTKIPCAKPIKAETLLFHDHISFQMNDTILSYFNKDKLIDKCIVKNSKDGIFISFFWGDKSGKDIESFNIYLPSLDVYETEINIQQERYLIELHYSSSFRTYFNIYLHFIESSGKWKVTKGQLYNPVQWDFDTKVEECSSHFDLPVEKLGDKINTIKGEVFDKKDNCQCSYTISRTFEEIYEFYRKGEDLKERRSGVDRIEAYLKRYPLNSSNLTKYNDLGFYMERDSLYSEASYLLSYIVKKFPARTVAYFNLGDAYCESFPKNCSGQK